ncbi:MAG: phage tail sheath family protein [Lachnospiraceae bacterium]|nr:phage tail sheath family protein [Lachnospiraceae bacterium]
MAEYFHRIDAEELPSQVTTPAEADAGLQVIVGLAPVNMVDDPAVNKPVMARSYAEAVAAMGFCYDFENYTISQAIDANFNVFSNAPIIFINVLDPKKHVKDYTKSGALVASGIATIEEVGIMKTGLTVRNGSATLNENEDYVLGFSTLGYLEITFTSSSVTNVDVTGKQLDPSKITKTDIIGGYNVSTGEATGIEALSQVYPRLGVVPGILLAPRWSRDPEVAAVMAAKTKEINGLFEAVFAVDIDTSVYKTYTAAAGARDAMGITSQDGIMIWLKQKLGTKVYDGSVIWAAATCATDSENDDVPKKSPSNIASNMAAAVLEDGTEVYLDNTQAAVLNAAGIVTFLNDNGWKVWGNNTTAFPGATAPEERWISCRRMMNWYKAHFILTFGNKVDDPTDYRLIEAVTDAENQYLNSLSTNGHIAGGKIYFRESDNPIDQILDGQIIFYTAIAFWTPAEHITNKIEFDPSLIQSALQKAA